MSKLARTPKQGWAWALEALVHASFLLPYLAQTLPRLGRPGLSTEEALTVLPIVGNGATVYLRWRSWAFPLNLIGYHGPMESYLSWPFALLFGHTAQALRVCVILLGALTLAALYRACLEFFKDGRVAWGAAFLCATAPSFVSGTRFGFFHGSAVLFFETVAALLLLLHRRSRRRVHLYAACLALGMGMACRMWFGMFLVAFGGSWLALGGLAPRFWPGLIRERWRPACACLLFFLLGALPLTVYGLTDAPRLFAFAGHFAHPQPGTDNLRYLSNLKLRSEQFSELWGGDPFTCEAFHGSPGCRCVSNGPWGRDSACPALPSFAQGLGARRLGWLWSVLPLLCLLWLAASALRFKGRLSSSRRLALPVFVGLYLLVTPVSIGWFRHNHVFTQLLPALAAVAAALAEWEDLLLPRLKRDARLAIFAAAILLLRSFNVSTLQERLATMAGVDPYFADANNEIGPWIKDNVKEPFLIDFGLGNPVRFESGGRIPEEIEIGSGHDDGIDFSCGPRYYVGYLPPVWGTAGALSRVAVERLGARAVLLRVFRSGDGTPFAGVYRLPPGLRVRDFLVPLHR